MAFRREATVRKAEKYVGKGKIEAAIDEYRKVLKHTPTDVNTLNRVGDLYARLERYDEAVRLFAQIAEQYTREGFFVKAIAIYKKIIKLDPSSLQVYEKLAALYAEQGLITEARTQYQVLADYYQKNDNAASTITIYQRMAELEPENPTFQLKLAELFTSRRLTDKALVAYARLADIFLVDGSIDEAAKVYLEALELTGEDLDFIETAVRGLFEAGNVGAAVRVLTRAVEINPAAAGLGARIGIDGDKDAPEAEVSVKPRRPAEPESDGAPELPVEDDTAPPVPEFEFDPAPSDTKPAKPKSVEAQPFRLDLDLDDLADSGEIDASEFPADSQDEANTPAIDPALEEEESGSALQSEVDASDVFVFDLDLDDEEVPKSLVRPPSDMLETELDGQDEAETSARLEPEELAELESIDLDDLDLAPAAAVEVPDEPSEIDWVADPELVDDAAQAPEPEPVSSPAVEEDELDVFEIAPVESYEDELTPGEPEIGEAEDSMVEVAAAPEPDLVAEEVVLMSPPTEPAVPAPPPLAAEPAPIGISVVRREEDLLAEAQVFAKYGLRDKAEERLRQLSNLNADNLEGLALKTRLLLEDGDHAGVMTEANSLADASERVGTSAIWHALRGHLAEVGYGFKKDRVVTLPGAGAEKIGDRITQFLDGLDRVAGAPVANEAETIAAPSDEALTGEIDSALDSFFGTQPGDEPDVRASVAGPGDAGGQASADDILDESGLGWLEDEPAAASDQSADAQVTPLFDEDDDFFDLAKEIEKELDEEDSDSATPVAAPKEPSLEEIVEGFKRGVAEHLSSEDYDTHFNLGIAYREMGLLDEGIGEFQLASKDPRYLVESSSMLGMSFLEKGLPSLAIKWYRKGLAAPDLDENTMLGLLYDMGTALEQSGDEEAAQRTWVEIYGINSHYRDVSERVSSS